MKRKIIPTGAKLILEDVFSGIQTSIENNRLDLIDRIFDNFGVIYSGEQDTSLEIFQASTDTIQVKNGYGLTSAGYPIVVKSSDPIADKQLSVAGYTGPVYIKNIEMTDTPTQILDGFAWLASGQQFRDTNQFDYFQLTILYRRYFYDKLHTIIYISKLKLSVHI